MPPLLLFTDPQRTPDVLAAAAALPRGAGVVYRGFGRPEAQAEAQALRRLTRRRGVRLFIGADAGLARRVRADGIHLPERLAGRAGALRRSGFQVTAAAHSLGAARRGLAAGAQAVVVSAVFPSASPSAGAPLGPLRFAVLARAAGGPVYGLGGINEKSARRLLATGAAGLAAVEGLAPGA
ncbi:MAG TPA: thiamine phosphate synthase [Phenylobacterium sp.]|nr:thiamine phosphate synthase [Phenylobacterium sp.]